MARNAQIPPADPFEPQSTEASAVPSPLFVDISHIQPYERNPRHGRNPEYDRIKDSIRRNGLDQPLVITQRPGATEYIVHAGGNTRLLILKELNGETGERRYSQVPCLFRAWNCESDVLLAHLRENDLRGSLSFIDKARAVFDAKRLIEEESARGEITHKDLGIALRESGYSIGSGAISQMAYAVRTLLPLIPQSLEAGMGKHKVERIRALERAARSIWKSRCSGSDTDFDDVFAALCQRYDGMDWDTDLLQGAIETEIAEESETNIQTIRVALDAMLAGREVVIPEYVPLKDPLQQERRDTADRNRLTSATDNDQEDAEIGLTDVAETSVASDDASKQPPDLPVDATADVSESMIDDGQYIPTDLKSLRGRAWTLAARLAQRNGFGDRVKPLSGKGLGYVLSDVPDHVLADQLDEDSVAQICLLWWQLAACSEMTFAPVDSIAPTLPADSVLRRALETQDAGLLFDNIWTLDPGHIGYRIWYSLPERDWRDLLNLMDTYRRIRYLAADTGTVIWD